MISVYEEIICFASSSYHSVFRFYNKLPEVKKQREEEQRKKAYSINRDKAKEYQQVPHICYPTCMLKG